MLCYKSWLETRLRFFVGAGAMAALCAFHVFYRPAAVSRWNEFLRLHPDGHRPWWINRAINEYPFYIWRILFDDSLHFLWAIFAVLIGVGGLTQESVRGRAQFTLALPESRKQLGWTHAAVCSIELIGLGLVPAVALPFFSACAHRSYSVSEAAGRGLVLAVGGLVIFSLTFLVAAISRSANVPIIMSSAAIVSLASLTGPYEKELNEPAVFRAIDLFRLISGPPDLHWRTFPWLGLLVSLSLALLLAWFAARVIDKRDYW
jgi:hypothetical protein